MLLNDNDRDEFIRPFFSVVITTYNRASLLARALRSLINQTEKDWEAIIIDDGSTDNTYQKISSFLNSGRNFRYIPLKSSGATFAKNQGIFLCSGKYITFLDSDDEYEPSHLATRKKILKENPRIDFLYGGVKVSGNPFVPDRYDYQKLIHLSDCVIGGSFFIRKALAKAMKGFKEIPLGSDADLFERIKATNSVMVEAKPATYIYHRETMNSITNNLAGCEEIRRENPYDFSC